MAEEEYPPPGLPIRMASIDPTKFVQAKISMKSTFGGSSKAVPVPFSISILPSPPKSTYTPTPRQSAMQRFKRITTDLEMNKQDTQVEAERRDNDSIILHINDTVLFDEGTTQLNPASSPLLRKMADIIRPLPMTMRIEGHSDSTPVGVGMYQRGELFAQDRRCAAGYGDNRPQVPNTMPDNKALNRRGDFIMHNDRSVLEDGKPSTPLSF